MKSTVLTLIFIAGLRVSIHDWKTTMHNFRYYRATYKKGFDPDSYYSSCTCGKCTPEEVEESKHKVHLSKVNNLAKNVSLQINQSIFHSGITLMVLYLIIQLIINK
jgi:hypothetical protein